MVEDRYAAGHVDPEQDVASDGDDFGCGNPLCPGDCETCFAEESDADDQPWPDGVVLAVDRGLL